MKIAFAFHPHVVRVPFNPQELWDDSRGLTGSELTYFMFAIELQKLGHEVVLFSKFANEGTFEGCKYYSYERWESEFCKQTWDVAFSSIMAHPLLFVSLDTFRIFNQQCCGFLSDRPGWSKAVDILAPLSHTHARLLKSNTHFDVLDSADAQALPDSHWRVLNNGVDLSKFSFDPKDKKPHKLIWASSHDRGLHWLLEAFPQIQKRVPDVELHIFYNMHSILITSRFFPGQGHANDLVEQGFRARYILDTLNKLNGKGVFVYNSVSRRRIEQEMHTASVLAYPLDPVYFTESFGVVVLEACASGVVPVICSTDAFPELWEPVSEFVPPPYKDHKQEWIDKVVHVLTDDEHRLKLAHKAAEYAKQFSWSILAKQLEELMLTRSTGLPMVQWDPSKPVNYIIPSDTPKQEGVFLPYTDLNECPIDISPDSLLNMAKHMWKHLLLHDEILCARSFLNNLPWQIRTHDEVKQMRTITSKMLIHIDSPDEGREYTDPYTLDREAIPLPGPVQKVYTQYNRFQYLVEEAAKLQETKSSPVTILDVGCTDGWVTNRFGMMGYKTYGIDIASVEVASNKAIEFNTGALHVRVEDITKLPKDFPPQFDIVVLFEVYEHVLDPVKLLKQVYQYVKPGGLFIMSTPRGSWCQGIVVDYHVPWNSCEKPREHIRAPILSEVLEDLKLAGFEQPEGIEIPIDQTEQHPTITGQATTCAKAVRPVNT